MHAKMPLAAQLQCSLKHLGRGKKHILLGEKRKRKFGISLNLLYLQMKDMLGV